MLGVTHPGLRSKDQHLLHYGFKENPDTRGSALSLLRIIVILFNTALVFDKFMTTAGQLLSAAKITRPRYQKEVTISKGSP